LNRLVGDGSSQCHFVCGPGQLPSAQPGRERNRQPSGKRYQPEPRGGIHWIMPCMKYLVLIAFLAILASLGTALYFMLRQGAKGNKMALALGMRVGISILLFVCILAAWKLGYIHPTGIAAGQ
jgi:hypothetical protein